MTRPKRPMLGAASAGRRAYPGAALEAAAFKWVRRARGGPVGSGRPSPRSPGRGRRRTPSSRRRTTSDPPDRRRRRRVATRPPARPRRAGLPGTAPRRPGWPVGRRASRVPARRRAAGGPPPGLGLRRRRRALLARGEQAVAQLLLDLGRRVPGGHLREVAHVAQAEEPQEEVRGAVEDGTEPRAAGFVDQPPL